MKTGNYNVMDVPGGKPVKMWTQSVPVEQDALRQLEKTARLPFIYKWLAAMPDVHVGKGSTIGSVIPTLNAIIPAAVGVDIGCGVAAVKTTLMASDLPDNLAPLRLAIERAVPHGRTPGKRDKGAWDTPPKRVDQAWRELAEGFSQIVENYPRLKNTNNYNHLGTLGTGNHFIEVCLDEANAVWFMLHSGSRGIGNAIGTFFIELAKQDMRTWQINLPDQDLAYLPEGTEHFNDYVAAVEWAQHYARLNREVMMKNLIQAARQVITKPFQARLEAVNCHHNYVSREHHYGQNILVTRKGAVRARQGELGIIPGSMGAKSYIVRGLGNEESFHSCFPKGTKLLTENGLMLIENVFQCADEVKLITYNSEAQQFETKQIVDKSRRIMPIAQYVVSQTGRRDNNIITCTDDHPFATYADASLVYKPVSEIAAGFGGVIVPTELGYYDSQLPATDEELTLYYLIGVILSDGTIFIRDWDIPVYDSGRPRVNKYKQAYIRIYQAASEEKAEFVQYIYQQLQRLVSSVSLRIQPARAASIRGQAIQGNGLAEITVVAQAFVEEVRRRVKKLSIVLLQNKTLALYFLAGYLDGDGTYGRGYAAISLGKQTNFSPVLYALLSLGVPYRIYNNRTDYTVEFRNNAVLEALRGICKRLRIERIPERSYGERFMLAQAMLCKGIPYEVRRKAQINGLISTARLPNSLQLDPKFSMNRIRRLGPGPDGVQEVYNFTVEANHNFIVMTDYYTPLLVHNCSHGAGRVMSRSEAKRRFTVADHKAATEGVECRKDAAVIDETPAAYKPIDAVMHAQRDLVEVVYTLKQVICVKG